MISCIWRKKKVRIKVRMWLPSTSASHMMMSLWYRSLATSKSSLPMPVPSAVIMVLISSEESILSKRAFSTLRILPLRGKTAWNRRSRPCFAEPPAESPSTRKSSAPAGFRSLQSASLPGRLEASSAPLRRVKSRALRAASRAWAASTHFSTIRRASRGFSSRKAPSFSATTCSIQPLICDETSLSLVCDENFGSLILTEMTAVSPSRTSSPVRFSLRPLASPELAA